MKWLITFVIFLFIMPISNVVNANLIALWEFDYESAIDSYGDNDGTFNGYPDFSNGHANVGRALELNGNDYVSISNESNFDITDKITVAAWIKVKQFDKPWQAIVTKGDSAWRLARTNQEGTLSFHLTGITSDNNGTYQNLGVESNVKADDGRWHHVAGVYDGSTIKIYIDGILDKSINAKGTIETNHYKIYIGGNAEQDGRDFKGFIDEVCIFSHALSEIDIDQLYKAGGGSFIPHDYMAKLTGEAKTIIKELDPQEAKVYLEKKIAEYEKWKARNIDDIELYNKRQSPDLYFLLAKAKEQSGVSKEDVISAYKQSILPPQRPSNCIPAALLWLSENISKEEFSNIVKECMQNSGNLSYDIYNVTEFFESNKRWSAFELFLNALLSEVEDYLDHFAVVDIVLKKDGEWANKFSQYCRSKPELTEFIFRNFEKIARSHIAQKNFDEAVKIYREIVRQCSTGQKRSIYEFKVCECLFNNSEYENSIKEIDSFIENNKATHRTLVSKAIMLKGQAYVQLGNVDQAIDMFLTLLIEYPQAKQAPEANFFVGYCYMLQGKFNDATEAFNLLMKDYPESSYTKQAILSLNRMREMTE